MKVVLEFVIQAIGGAEGDRWRCRRLFYVVPLKAPKHMLQDESLFEPIFFKTSNLFRWSILSDMPQDDPVSS